MIKIGILGEIGSGKSYVARNFGYPVFNADYEVAKLYKQNKNTFNKLKTKLPKYIHSFPIQKEEIANAFQEAVVDVLVQKSMAAIAQTGINQLVVAGGVGANYQLRESLSKFASKAGITVFYPDLEFCTDNGAMIAFAGAIRLKKSKQPLKNSFIVKARWDLESYETL